MTSLEDPILEILPIVRGYHQIAPLQAAELELLFDLIRIRIATSITMAAIQIAADPGNEYLLISQDHFRELFNCLCRTDSELSHFRFRNACGYDANPNSRAIRQWLQSGNAPISDVVMPPLESAKKIWLDWSSDNENIPRSNDQIVELMQASGATLAIGHYCENRMVYEGEAFSIDSPNRRSVHLGVDLFAPAGTPVYAGHDGTVEYFNDNNVHLDYGPVIILRHETSEKIPFWTLYGHLSRPSLENLSIGKQIKAGEQIATMGEEFENVGWPPHTHFQLLTSLCGMGLDVYGVAPLDELPMWRSISPNPNLILKIAEGTDKHTHLRTNVLLDERQVVMSRALSLNFKNPLEIVRGSGAYLYDQNDQPYLDLVNNVAHVGHGHPRVVAAGAEQMARLNTNTRYVNQNAIEYARSLASTFPDPLNVVFFVNSGSEANDLALRLAQAHTGNRGMLVLDHAYHGHLSSIIDISPYKFNGRGGRGCPDHVRVVPLPDSYKGLHRGPDAGAKYASEFTTQLNDLPIELCAFISESIVSTAGQVTLADGFLKSAYEQTRAAGGVCIADEVQIGMGRIGSGFWGFELHGVVPDIVTIGKPIGNGHPLAAVVTTPEIANSFMTGMEYFNTFGGNPVSAAIGQAVLDVIVDQDLQANAQRMGQLITDGFRSLAKDIEYIGDVRGSGLFLGVELVTDRQTQAPATGITSDLMEFAKNRGVFLSCDGPANNVLKIKPPMILNQADVDLFLTVVAEGLR
jgi:4-aminobutyrate aminotransferase-like enzyme